MVLAPLAAFVIAVSSVRGRRASMNTAMLGAVVTLAATLLVGWGLARKTTGFSASYVYLTANVGLNGPTAFQNFEVDIVLHADHLTVVALAVIELCFIGVLAWARIAARNEPGPVRFQSLISVFLFGCVGALLSTDLAEMFSFWALAGGATYLMLAHRWGDEAAARSGRIALALPFLTDLFLLCGIAVLYSRYGQQNISLLVPALHTTAGWTVRQIAVAAVLMFVGVAGRMALWPLHEWLTGTAPTAPPAASAIALAAWPVVGVTVLYHLLPIFVASDVQTMRWLVIACGASAVGAGLYSLVAMEPRRALVLAGAAVAAIGAAITIRGFQFHAFTFAVAGLAAVYASAPARAAGALAASNIVNAMRTEDMREMGDAWRRMRSSAVALLGVAVALGVSAAGALAFGVDSRSRFGVVLGEAVFVLAVAGMRAFLATSSGPLRRRRAFDPDRVREAPRASLSWPYWLVVASLALTAASFVPAWLGFLDNGKHATVPASTYALWVAVALAGLAAAALPIGRNKDGALRASSGLALLPERLELAARNLLGRYVVTPAVRLVEGAERLVPAADAAVGRISHVSGRYTIAALQTGDVAVLVVMGVLLALLVALLSPAVLR
ncbi:MAG TPA: proton-conducting transporter membrane subunit [Candidatus Dormibacteraeota bacterium]|nr:proton-conducting transporter membrane subunit [Candidatus Dormibacteraeota bacterium]